jgi:hypothetical protein
MILTRFARHLRSQDWTAIGIEFALVVAGIVIGLQITAWYQIRDLAEQEQLVLAALAEEVKANLDELDAMLAFTHYKMSSLEELARRIDGERTTDDSLVSLFADLLWSRRVRFSDGAITGTIASGGLALITNGDLRRSLAGLAGRMDDYEVTSQAETEVKRKFVVPFVLRHGANPQLYEAQRSAPGEPVDTSAHGRWVAPRTGRIDFEDLLKQPELAGLLVISHANIADANADGRVLRAQLEAMLDRINAERKGVR